MKPQTKWLLFLAPIVLSGMLWGCARPLQNLAQRPRETTPTVTVEATQATPEIVIAPDVGTAGIEISIAGAGWQPNENIYIDFVAVDESNTLSSTIAIAAVNSNGLFAVSLDYPADPQWQAVSSIIVIASSLETNQHASTLFYVVPVTPTPTEEAHIAIITPTVTISTTIPRIIAKATATSMPTATPIPPTATSTTVPITQKSPTPTLTDTITPTSTPHIAPSATRVPPNAMIIPTELSVHSGPSIAYPITAALSREESVAVLDQNEDGTWLYVRLDNDTFGWLSREHVSFSVLLPMVIEPGPSTSTATVAPTDTPIPTSVPTDTPTSTATPVPALTITEWRGEYFDNPSLTGSPLLIRNDYVIRFNWQYGSPAPGMTEDDFSARWTRTQNFADGHYRFHIMTDDGMRLFIDDALLIDEWRVGDRRETTYDIHLESGDHDLRVEYYDHRGNAYAELWWELVLTESYPDWKGEYWRNRDLDGDPTFVRNDTDVNFNWSNNSPHSQIPADDFSARWSRTVNFACGTYRFYARADDGIRVYIDGEPIIDKWRASPGTETYTAERELSEPHLIEVEYSEHSDKALVEFWWHCIVSP